MQQSQDRCQFNTFPPRALDDVSSLELFSGIKINLGVTNQNFITASVAVTVANFSFVFAAYTNNNGDHFVTGVRKLIIRPCQINFLFNGTPGE